MKRSLAIFVVFCVLALPVFSQTTLIAPIIDGPYVFYQGDSIVVKNVENRNGECIAKRRAYARTAKSSMSLTVHLSGHPDWDFNVQLSDKVIVPPSTSDNNAEKIFILSDIEGEFQPFRELLLAAKVIDRKYNWTFGKGNLIIAGDLFDRGKQVCQFLWLLYKLEQEAPKYGGEVHVILGNHDIMNLSGDFGYVQKEYFANANLLGQDYNSLYGKDTELGRWLRCRNIVEKIGDQLVVHGGISQPINELQIPLQKINDLARTCFEVANKRERITTDTLLRIFASNTSPFWYRGYFMTPRADSAQVDSTLKLYQCRQIVVGHTILAKNAALYYKGKVLDVDVDEHAGKHQGVIYLQGYWFIINNKGRLAKLEYKKSNDLIKDTDFQ